MSRARLLLARDEKRAKTRAARVSVIISRASEASGTINYIKLNITDCTDLLFTLKHSKTSIKM